MIASLFAADKYRVILSGEYPDYIHAVAANVRKLIRASRVSTTVNFSLDKIIFM